MKNEMVPKKNILIVSDDFLPAATGVGIHLQILCQEMVRLGHNVVILTSKQGLQKDEEIWEGVQVHRFFSLKVAGFYQAIPKTSQIRKIISQNKIDIVHFHYLSFMMVLVTLVVKKLSLKKVYTYHMTEDHLTQPWFMRPFRGLIRALIIRFSNWVDVIMSPSKKLKGQITHQGIKTPIYFLTNPVSKDFFHKKKASELRQSPFQILFVGRLNPEKNIPLLLKAFASHLQSHPDSRLWIIGKGDQEAKLKDLADKLQISGQIDFLGFMTHDQLSAYYHSCDIFVLPSTVETQGMVAMEAMTFSKPVIVTKEIVSAEELVDHDCNGYIVDAFDPDDLAAKLNLLAKDSSLRERLGIAGRLKIKDYDPEVVTKRLLHIYDDLQFQLTGGRNG